MCSNYSDDLESIRFSYTTWRRARIKHDCCACTDGVLPREWYWVLSGVDADGEPFRVKQCARCHAIFKRLIQERNDASHAALEAYRKNPRSMSAYEIDQPAVRVRLDCDEKYEGDMEVAAQLAFASREEAQNEVDVNDDGAGGSWEL